MKRADIRLQILLLCISGIVLASAYLLWADYQSGIRRNALEAARNARQRAELRRQQQLEAQSQQAVEQQRQQEETARLWRQQQQAILMQQQSQAQQPMLFPSQAVASPPTPAQAVPPSDLDPRIHALEEARREEEQSRRDWLRDREIDWQIQSRDRGFQRDFRNFVVGGGARSRPPHGGIPGKGFIVGP